MLLPWAGCVLRDTHHFLGLFSPLSSHGRITVRIKTSRSSFAFPGTPHNGCGVGVDMEDSGHKLMGNNPQAGSCGSFPQLSILGAREKHLCFLVYSSCSPLFICLHLSLHCSAFAAATQGQSVFFPGTTVLLPYPLGMAWVWERGYPGP